jgi:hypothetical protein
MNSVELAPGIISFEGILDDPAQFIVDLEGMVEINTLTWTEAQQSAGAVNSEHVVQKSTRNCKAMSLPRYDEITDFDPTIPTYLLHKFLNDNLNPVLDLYCNEYTAHHWKKNEGWQLLKYGADNYFVNHYDDSKQYPRTVSMSFYLNDDYEGGEIEFSRFNLKIKPKANQAIFFPSNYVYNHTVHPVTSGTRYAVVGWWE